MGIWYLASMLFFEYVLLKELELPVILQPVIFSVLALLCFLQYYYYGKRWSLLKTFNLGLLVLALTGVLMLGIYICIHYSSSNTTKEILFFILGLVPSILTALAYIPQMYELWVTKNPYGISIIFLLVDMSGALCFFLSLVLFPDVDWLAATTYLIVLSFNSGILITCVTWRFVQSRRLKQETAIIEEGTVEIMSETKAVMK